MKINYKKLSSGISQQDLLAEVLEFTQGTPSLVSGAHQFLMNDGRIDTFGCFSEITGQLAADLQSRIPDSKLFLQINDQLNFQGLSQGLVPQTGIEFWSAPWQEIKEEGHYPCWDEELFLQSGLNIHGEACPGLVSEWYLQRWHMKAGLNNRNKFKSRSFQGAVLQELSKIPEDEGVAMSCRANGCANEIMIEAPFCVERGFNQLIGFWPLACKGSVLYGSTAAVLAMSREMSGPERAQERQVHFRGPFSYIHVFLNSYEQPKSYVDLLNGASICQISTQFV